MPPSRQPSGKAMAGELPLPIRWACDELRTKFDPLWKPPRWTVIGTMTTSPVMPGIGNAPW